MSHVLRLVLFTLLFALLCVKASELYSRGGASLARNLFAGFATDAPAVGKPEPLRSRAYEFRGLTPVPTPSGTTR